MNANVDLIVSAVDVFTKVGIKSTSEPKDHEVINTLQELDECFSHHFKKCAAAERFIASAELFDKLTKASTSFQTAKVDMITLREESFTGKTFGRQRQCEICLIKFHQWVKMVNVVGINVFAN